MKTTLLATLSFILSSCIPFSLTTDYGTVSRDKDNQLVIEPTPTPIIINSSK